MCNVWIVEYPLSIILPLHFQRTAVLLISHALLLLVTHPPKSGALY
jgi:hypothetical protein